MTLCFCVQVTHATDIPPVVSNHGTVSHAALSSEADHKCTNGSVPHCAMNPAYEYALPTHVAHLMAGPTVETTLSADTLKETKGGPFHGHGGGHRGIIRRLQLSMHAATQPADLRSPRQMPQTKDGGGSSGSGGGMGSAITAPLAIARSNAFQQESLEAQSDTGSTVIVAPYMASGGTDMSPVHTQDQTVGGTETATTQLQDDVELPPPPLPPQPEMFGIRLGRAHDTDSTRDSAGSSALLRGGRQQRWRRSCVDASEASSRVNCIPEDASPAAVLTAQQLMDRLHWQLDGFGSSDQFLGRFELLGRHERRRGGALTMAQLTAQLIQEF